MKKIFYSLIIIILLTSCSISSKKTPTQTPTNIEISSETATPLISPTITPLPPTDTPTATIEPTATTIAFTLNPIFEQQKWDSLFIGQTSGKDGHLSLLCQVIDIDRDFVIQYADGVVGYIKVTCAFKGPNGIQTVFYTFVESNFNTMSDAIIGLTYANSGTVIQENAGQWLDKYEKDHGKLIGKVVSLMFFDANRIALEDNIPTAEIIKKAYPNFSVFDTFKLTGNVSDLPVIANTTGLVKPLMTSILLN